jgi:hypothetical protein
MGPGFCRPVIIADVAGDRPGDSCRTGARCPAITLQQKLPVDVNRDQKCTISTIAKSRNISEWLPSAGSGMVAGARFEPATLSGPDG